MKKMIVAYVNVFDNELHQFIVEANTWKEALIKCLNLLAEDKSQKIFDENAECVNSLPDDIEEAKAAFFDQDQLFSVLEIG